MNGTSQSGLFNCSPIQDEKYSAETSTAYSDSSQRVISCRCNITKSWEALVLLFYLINSNYQYWETDVVYQTINQRAYACNYNGEWRTVQKLLCTEPQTPEQYKQVFLQDHSPEELYGNILHPDIQKRMARRIIEKDLTKSSNHKVRETQRKRGYTDKGSRRLPHEYHGEPNTPKEREDYRSQIKHPILSAKFQT
jgi:hypothetical protein